MIKTYKPNDTARIEAMRFDSAMATGARRWTGDDLREMGSITIGDISLAQYEVHTLEGWVDMPYGSYLIKGTNGEFYPCDPDVFEKRWVEV